MDALRDVVRSKIATATSEAVHILERSDVSRVDASAILLVTLAHMASAVIGSLPKAAHANQVRLHGECVLRLIDHFEAAPASWTVQ